MANLAEHLAHGKAELVEALADGKVSVREIGQLAKCFGKCIVKYGLSLGKSEALDECRKQAHIDWQTFYSLEVAPAVDIGGRWVPDALFDAAVVSGVDWVIDSVFDGLQEINEELVS